MMRPLLPVIGALILCAQSFTVLAANSTSSTPTSNAAEQLRQQVEAQRDQLSGADQIPAATQTGASTLLDSAIETDDAPAQVDQQP